MDQYTENDFRALRSSGLTIPSNPVRAAAAAQTMKRDVKERSLSGVMADRQRRERLDKFAGGGNLFKDNPEAKEVHNNRQANGGGSFQLSYPLTRDPFEYWSERYSWYKPGDDGDEQVHKIQNWARMVSITHHLVPSLIEIYARFPVLSLEFSHRDKRIEDFYNTVMLDHLNYQEFLYDIGREVFTVGEAFPLGSWHDAIGMWESDELINPQDVLIQANHALKTNMYSIAVPEDIQELVDNQRGTAQYRQLVEMHPEFVQWARSGQEIPVSTAMIKHLKFKMDPWSRHGSPILLRAFRQLMLEESLNAAQDAVADRLYSPLILARLGLDNVDEDGPWLPDPSELDALRNELNLALVSDFRLVTYHHGLQIDSVFGRESMPDFGSDFDRIETKIMEVFGIGSEMLRGGNSGATYASGALNRELITSVLETYQHQLQRFCRQRMEPIAEAQAHYEMEKKGDRYYPIMERVLLVDEQTGEEYIKERPKLAVPDMVLSSMSLRDEKVERDFIGRLADAGFPVSYSAMAHNIPLDFSDQLVRKEQEELEMVLSTQRFKADLFRSFYTENLTVPEEYRAEFDEWLAKQEGRVDITHDGPLKDLVDDGGTPGGPGGDFGGGGLPADFGDGGGFDDLGGDEGFGDEDLDVDYAPDISYEQAADAPQPVSSRENIELKTPESLTVRRKMVIPEVPRGPA